MSVRNSLVSVVMMLFVVFGIMKVYMFYSAKQNIDTLITPMRAFLNVDYNGISTSIFGPVGVKGLRFTTFNGDEVLTFGKVTLSSYEKDKNEKIPSKLFITLEEVKFDSQLLTEVKDDDIPTFVKELGYGELYKVSNNLQKLGYDKIISDINFEFTYKKDLGSMKLQLRENIQQFGELNILLDVIGYIPGLDSITTDIKINEMMLMFKDNSYTDRLLKQLAVKEGMIIDEYRNEIVAQLKNYLESNKIVLKDDDIKALKKFIVKPEKIIVSVQPTEPISLESLKYYKREDVQDILNFNISSQ